MFTVKYILKKLIYEKAFPKNNEENCFPNFLKVFFAKVKLIFFQISAKYIIKKICRIRIKIEQIFGVFE